MTRKVGFAAGLGKLGEIGGKVAPAPSPIARPAEAVEAAALEQKGLNPNVDFYAATVYRMLGIPTDLMTPIFALARMAGWTAHVREQYVDNRIIRPGSVYVGPTDRRWSPIASR